MNNKIFSGHQPNFLPYMGFFYKMYKSDIFVIDDDVQYSRCGLHNANYLKINNEKHKITIPVKYDFEDKINSVKISYDRDWIGKFLRTIRINYGKAPYFDEGYNLIEKHINRKYEKLVDLNIGLIEEIASKFGIDCKISIASKEVETDLKKNERNVYQCLAFKCNIYYSGIGGKEYNDEEYYKSNGIDVIYSDYSPVEYKQIGKGFIENLSVLDYIFNNGYRLPEGWSKEI